MNLSAEAFLEDYLAGNVARSSLAAWAAEQLRLVPSRTFDASSHGQLAEYVLSRMLDDDWTPEAEYAEDVRDLLMRLRDARVGNVRLP